MCCWAAPVESDGDAGDVVAVAPRAGLPATTEAPGDRRPNVVAAAASRNCAIAAWPPGTTEATVGAL